jgi:WD40 repeat protein
VLIAFLGGLFWRGGNAQGPDGDRVASSADGPNMPGAKDFDRLAGVPSLAGEGLFRPTVRFALASDAPVIVGTGGLEPIELGAEVPYTSRSDTLHVWDWSRSRKSRVMKDIHLSPDQSFCRSPDGTRLVWAKGDVVNLTNGERSTIDLGGELHLGRQGGMLRRIEHLQFTPDGRRLALLLANLVLTKSSHPVRRQDLTTSPSFQIVEFPSGKLVCEFPAGDPADLPLAFSADGKRAVSQYSDKPGSKIVERSLLTGEVGRGYQPHLREFASAIGLSADGSLLAAYDTAGGALLWDTLTGKLKHKVALPPGSWGTHLRFSPDGKLLALSLFPGPSPKLILIDVAAGTIVARVSQEGTGDIHWSADGKSFDVTYDRRSIREDRDRAGGAVMYNLYPSVQTWKVADISGQ